MDADGGNQVRKLRKKLRQIAILERLDRDLTPEEEDKVDAKEKLRSDLQNLLKNQEEEMVKLANNVDNTTMYEKQQVVQEFDHNVFFQNYASAFNTNQKDGEKPAQLFTGYAGSPFSIGFSDDGNVAVDIAEKNDVNGVSEVVITEDVLTDAGIDTQKTNTTEIDSSNIATVNDVSSEIPDQVPDSTNSETGSSTPVDQDTQETGQEFPITRRSLRERKPKFVQPVSSNKKIDYLPSPEQLFEGLDLKMNLLQGHHDDTCAIDLYDNFVVSGGRDTSLKLWIASSQEELKSIGGHESTITGVCFMKDKQFSTYPNCVTSSYDCSVRVWDLEKGNCIRSIYVYSPVVCLDYANGVAVIGTEGGKVELYNIETGEQLFTVNAYECAVSAIKLFGNGNIACGSADGIVKVYDPQDGSKAVFELDPDTIKVVSLNNEEMATNETSITPKLHSLKVNCMVLHKDLIIYGDDGYNVKVLDYQKGEIVKICNNVKEYCPTEALNIANVYGREYLFSIGSDVDSGDSYINVRVLPELRYVGTIRDVYVNSGAITSFVLQIVNSKIRFITGGTQLRTWDQEVRRGKKRKSTAAAECLIPCKYMVKYEESRESETEPEIEIDNQSQTSSVEVNGSSTEEQKKSYCVIL